VTITYDFFAEHFTPLVKEKKPRGWDNDIQALYFDKMKGWQPDDWSRVCHWMIVFRERSSGMTAFPQISEFFAVRRRLEDQERKKKEATQRTEDGGALKNCQHCLGGRINFDVNVRGIAYEKFAACDCDSGDIIAAQMQQLARLAHKPRITLEAARYSWLVRDHGGIGTADGGFGLMAEPPVQVTMEEAASYAGVDPEAPATHLDAIIDPEMERLAKTPVNPTWSGDPDDELPF